MQAWFEEAGGCDKIEGLQTHENEAVYAKAASVIETFFVADEEDQSLLPAVNAHGFEFGMQGAS